MKKTMKRLMGVTAWALMGISACSQEVPEPHEAKVQVPPQAQVEGAPGAVGKVVFTVQPESFRICETDNGATTATAKWNAEGVRPSGVAIYVIDADGDRKLWVKGGAAGESTTGAWVFPDTRFVLVEEGSGRQLAEVQVRGVACE